MADSVASRYVTECGSCAAVLSIQLSQIGKRCRCPVCKKSVLISTVRSASTEAEKSAAEVKTITTVSGGSHGSTSSESESPSDEKTPHRQLGRFTLTRKLGFGAFGEVWMADDKRLDRIVAIKLPRFAANDVKRSRRFIAEAKAAAALRHPNIVPIFDAGQIGDQLFIATEYISGIPLSEVNEGGPSPIRWAVTMIAKLADALHYAHSQNIVHRDIKPDNVIVDRQGEPQLLDFGLAKKLDDSAAHTIDGTVLGTPAYMSPEQARGDIANVGPASDQFSLGVAMYRLLAGRTPFTGPPVAILQQIMTQVPPRLSEFVNNMPADLDAICEKARAENPQDRYPSCKAFAQDLRNFLAGELVTARPLSLATRTVRWAKKNPRNAVLSASCVVVSTILFLVSTTGWISAAQNTRAAAASEARVRAETLRLQSLEQTLQQRVDDAAKSRDAALAARNAEAASRQALESETANLAAATIAADQASKQAEESGKVFDAQRSSNAELAANLNAAMSKLTDSSSPLAAANVDSPKNASPTVVESDPNGPQTNASKVEPVLVCEWNGEPLVCTFAGKKVAKIRQKLNLSPLVTGVSFDVDKTPIVGWGSGTGSDLGIAHLSAQGGLTPKVPITHVSNFSLEDHLQGKFYEFYGKHATDGKGNVYLRAPSRGMLKYDVEKAMFEVIPEIPPVDDYAISYFDSMGLYSPKENSIVRYDLDQLTTTKPTVVFKLQSKGTLKGARFLTSDILIFSFGGNLVILYKPTKQYFTLRDQAMTAITSTPDGNCVARMGNGSLVICDFIAQR